ncbi:MAG: hypothetical protein GXO86_01160 [Chlorobi bacterium]|nr:hypothetical protein [Chlorobiota bacterium]
MEKNKKKVKQKEEEQDLMESLEEISDLKKNENKALKKIYDALIKDTENNKKEDLS